MKLLYICDRYPWPPKSGGMLRHARLLEQLALIVELRLVVLDFPNDASCPVSCKIDFFPFPDANNYQAGVCTKWGKRRALLEQIFAKLPSSTREHYQTGLVKVISQITPIAVECGTVWTAWPHLAALAPEYWRGVRVVCDFMDIATLADVRRISTLPWSSRKILLALDLVKMAYFERSVARKAWRSLVCKPEDGFFLSQPRKVRVVPNGTDRRPDYSQEPPEDNRLLFVGTLSYHPNQDAVTWFVKCIFPLLQSERVSLDVVGGSPSSSIQAIDNSESIHVHGFVPTLDEFYRSASVVIAPLRLGSGTKLKVLEALAFGKALVATSEAAKGLQLISGVHYLAADNSDEFAEACKLLLRNRSLAIRLGQAGREFVNSQFSWKRVGDIATAVVSD
jgi:polysaccharide biosynthesis protein PslH